MQRTMGGFQGALCGEGWILPGGIRGATLCVATADSDLPELLPRQPAGAGSVLGSPSRSRGWAGPGRPFHAVLFAAPVLALQQRCVPGSCTREGVTRGDAGPEAEGDRGRAIAGFLWGYFHGRPVGT